MQNQSEESIPSRTLVRKLADIRRQISFIPKAGEIKGQSRSGVEFSFPVSRAEDVINRIGPMLAERHIVIFPKVVKCDVVAGKTDKDPATAMVLIEYTIEDGESGESRIVQMPGAGADKGEKAVPKAVTSADKQMLLQLLQIAPQEPDGQRSQPRPQNQQARPSSNADKSNPRTQKPAEWIGTISDLKEDHTTKGECFIQVKGKDIGYMHCFKADLFDAIKLIANGTKQVKLKLNWRGDYANIVGIKE